jgi:hypothetical protein
MDYHFVRERVSRKQLQFCIVSFSDQVADSFTKPQAQGCLHEFRSNLNICKTCD